MELSTFLQQSVNAISIGAIYALFALGYALVFSILGVLNLAHSAIFMWGAFIGLLALDPEQAPVLIAFSVAASIMAIPYYGIERYGIQRFPKVIDERIMRFILLVLRIFLLWLAWTIGGYIYNAVIGLIGERLINIAPILAVIIAMIGGGIISILLELVAFRPLRARNAARLAQLISSIGAALVLVNLAQFAYQALFQRTEAYYPRDIALLAFVPTEAINAGGVVIAPIRIVILVVAIVLMIALQYMVTRTQIGQQMRAVAFKESIASLLGIDVSRVYLITFFLAGAFGGVAGILYGITFSNVTPFIGENISLVGLTAIVLGGLGSIQGAVIGGFLVAIIQTFSVAFGGSSYRNAIVFIVLFLVLLIRPQGLLGQPEQNRA